jgi:hypothetical protein
VYLTTLCQTPEERRERADKLLADYTNALRAHGAPEIHCDANAAARHVRLLVIVLYFVSFVSVAEPGTAA